MQRASAGIEDAGILEDAGRGGERKHPPRRVLAFDVVRHRGTSLIRNTPRLDNYSRTIPRVLWWS